MKARSRRAFWKLDAYYSSRKNFSTPSLQYNQIFVGDIRHDATPNLRATIAPVKSNNRTLTHPKTIEPTASDAEFSDIFACSVLFYSY